MIYDFHFESEKGDLTIAMNDAARLFDYMQVFDSYRNQPRRIDVTSIQKKVFKPDSRYPHLVLPCYPHTFGLGRNFSSFMDNCMSGYILSPFSIDTANILKREIEKKEDSKHEDIKHDLLNAVKGSAQFQKCVQYILMKRYAGRAGEEAVKEIIISEYENFIDRLYEILIKNRLLILEQFDAIVIVLNSGFSETILIKAGVSIFSGISAVASGTLGIFKFKESWTRYRYNCEMLKREASAYINHQGVYASADKREQTFYEHAYTIINEEILDWRKLRQENDS